MKKMRAKIALAVATAGVVIAMIGSASASSVCVTVHASVNGHTVDVQRCITH